MSAAYRSAYDHIIGVKLAEVEEARAQLEPLMPGLRAIGARRVARMAAGGVGIAGAVAMVCFATITRHFQPATTYTLLASSAAFVATWLGTRAIVGAAARFRAPAQSPALSGTLEADLARIDASDPRTELSAIAAKATRDEAASVWMPATAIALLMPLLLHYVVGTFVYGDRASDFDEWIKISMVIVGHAHLALVLCCVLFARKIRKMPLEALAAMRIHREWAKIWLIVIGVSCLPGIILYLVPPILVALTGLVVVPSAILTTYRAVLAERTALAAATAMLRVDDASAKEEKREPHGEAENDQRDADDGAEGEPALAAAHRVGDDDARR